VSGSPAWRRAFDGVERRVAPPLQSVTGSPNFQITVDRLRGARRTVARPVNRVVSWGLHIAGLPSHADLRGLRNQLIQLEREVLSIRREKVESESERERPESQ
jgi:hypothetical protein